ncbi:MAG: TolC family protein [Chlorobi bacterium]|nr:TolC family protein [Chlorobiota bacterium]
MKRALWLVALVWAGFLSAQEGEWTLEQCLRYARTAHPAVKRAETDILIKEEQYRQTKRAALPSLRLATTGLWNYGLTQNLTTGILEHQTVFGNNVRLSSDMPLFRGLYLQHAKAAAELDYRNARLAFQSAWKRRVSDIVRAYADVAAGREAERAAESHWQAVTDQMRKMKELVDAGLRPAGEYEDLRAQAAQAYYQYVQIRSRRIADRWRLARLIGTDRPVETASSLPGADESLLLASPDSLAARYLSRLTEKKQSELDIRRARRQTLMARSALFPALSLFVTWNSRYMDREKIVGVEPDPDRPYRVIGFTEHSRERVLAPNFRYVTGPPDPYFVQLRENQGTAVGLSLSFDLFNRGEARSRLRTARLREEQARQTARERDLELLQTLHTLHADALGAARRREAALRSLEAARTAFRYAREKFEAGLLTSYDLSQARARLMQAQADYISAKYGYWLRLKLLEIFLETDPSLGL